MKQVGRVWQTVRHLNARQVAYQVLTRLRGRARLTLPAVAPSGYFLGGSLPDKPVSWIAGTFTFLNRSAHLPVVDWNYGEYGKLWTYNLNYFDFLNQSTPGESTPGESTLGESTLGESTLGESTLGESTLGESTLGESTLGESTLGESTLGESTLGESTLGPYGMSAGTGLAFIRAFMGQTDRLNDGLESYPTSLRITNWVLFLSRNQIQDDAINQHLYAQAGLLRRRLEYHIAGNHLLENGFALLTAALYFRQDDWLKRSVRLVRDELSGQLLADGGHAERSPMYHQILLDRLLDLLLALRHDTWHKALTGVNFLDDAATRMLAWLNAVTFRNGEVPMVNDAAPGIAPTTAQLRAKAIRAGLNSCLPEPVQKPGANKVLSCLSPLVESGYRKFTLPRYELLADVGAIGPDHQPGHAHADTLSFMLHVDNQPILVDSGTSTYDSGPRRAWERSTAAHNTVDVMDINSSEVWAGFRVGRRARATVLTDTPTILTACHDGYQKLGITHERTWAVEASSVRITDRLLRSKTAQPQMGVARLYFHPDVPVSLVCLEAVCGPVRILFASVPSPQLRLTTHDTADGFNRLRLASCVEITFTNCLQTILIPIP